LNANRDCPRGCTIVSGSCSESEERLEDLRCLVSERRCADTYPRGTASEDASGPSEESTTTIGDVMTKIPLFPGNDPDYPDSLVKKNPNSQSKKSKPVTLAAEKNSTKAKDVTPALPVSGKESASGVAADAHIHVADLPSQSPSVRLSSRGRKLKGAHEEAIEVANNGDHRDPSEAAIREGSTEQEMNTA